VWHKLDDPACGSNARRLAQQYRDSARGIAAGFDLAAIAIEDAHAQICRCIGLKHDQLVAADACPAIGNRHRKFARNGGQGGIARIKHDEIIAQPMHLDEGNAHSRCALCGRGVSVQHFEGQSDRVRPV